MRKLNTRQITTAALIGGIYVALSYFGNIFGLTYGPVQCRFSEALTVLPFFMPRSAVPGLFLGCFLANFLGGAGIWDVVFGSAATLIAAMLTARCRSRMLSPLAPVLVNAVVVGAVLYFVYYSGSAVPMWLPMAQVGLGQFVACYGLGLPLLGFLEKRFPSWREREGEQEGCALKGEGKA